MITKERGAFNGHTLEKLNTSIDNGDEMITQLTILALFYNSFSYKDTCIQK